MVAIILLSKLLHQYHHGAFLLQQLNNLTDMDCTNVSLLKPEGQISGKHKCLNSKSSSKLKS